jgi:N-acyl-D-aspartate/D-glutamate deacylase
MASFDLVVRGGDVVDGTGAPARTADVAVRDGVVVEVGRVEGRGRQEIDADGAIVAPGFVDIHTHYDGQATWDERLDPSSGHGVTTVVSGNCGVGFAPVRPADRDQLVELMEGIEDLPGSVLHEGLGWQWETFEQYLDVLAGRRYDIDIATQMCHAPVRLNVMGQRGADRAPATTDEIETMGTIVAAGIRAGALGFSTSRTVNHRSSKGDPTPSLGAANAELLGIARAVGATGAGVLQVVSDFEQPVAEADLLLQMMRESGRPLSISLVQARPGDGYRHQLALLERANAAGLAMRAQVAARAVGLLVGVEASVNPLQRTAVHRQLQHLPVAERARALADPDTRAVLVAELRGAGTGLPLERLFELGDHPDYEPAADSSIAARAARDGRDPVELLVDVLLRHDGRNLLYLPALNYFDGNLDAAAEMLAHPNTVPGLGDGGAHVGTIYDASFPTTLLSHWTRDRQRHCRFSVPWVIHRHARCTAVAVGLADRGLLQPGYKADLNVIDLDAICLHRPPIVADLPAGGRRLLQRADGYRHTIVTGAVTRSDGEPTDQLPGRLVRHQRPDPHRSEPRS